MEVNRSSYYNWTYGHRAAQEKANEALIPIVLDAHRESRGSYGSRRMAEKIKNQGIPCGRYRARTVMKMAGVQVQRRRKFRVTANSKHNLPVAPNLVKRNFTVEQPNQIWVGDITYIWTNEGWLYLTVIIDLFSRRIVGWSTSNRITKELVLEAMTMAAGRRNISPGLIFHSDRGSQYCSDKFQKLLRRYRIRASMSRKGDCWDHTVAESFFGSLKTERIFGANYKMREEAKRDLFDYIEMFYNCRRKHSFIDNKSPMEWEMEKTLKNLSIFT